MTPMENAWKMLKGNPDARVQRVNPENGAYSQRDCAIHPAALGAANRQTMAARENLDHLKRFVTGQGQKIPNYRMHEVAHQMVTPEQRARMKNNSFDLYNKNPRFVNKIRNPSEDRRVVPLTDGEKEARKIQAMGARARRRDAGYSRTGLNRRKI